MKRTEVEAALKAIPEGHQSHKLMLGVLVTDRTLRGETNRKPGRYPAKENLKKIYVSDDRALNFVHYSTERPEALVEELEEVIKLVGSHLEGFQLNMMRPPIDQLESFREKHPGMLLVFQLRPDLLDEHGNDLSKVIELELDDYRGLVDYISFDMSLGWGIPMDVEEARVAARKLTKAFPGTGIGVAGGLDAEKLYKIEALSGEFPDLCIDAETGMRSGDERDVLVQEKANSYIQRAFEIFMMGDG